MYEKYARYDRSARFWERVLGVEPARRWLCAQAEGGVLEIGIGTGRGLSYYSTSVRITGYPCLGM
jgi:hypothetical protein